MAEAIVILVAFVIGAPLLMLGTIVLAGRPLGMTPAQSLNAYLKMKNRTPR